MDNVQQRNSIELYKYYFLNNNKQITLMSIDQIINGYVRFYLFIYLLKFIFFSLKEDFIGLISFVLIYLNSFEDIHVETRLNFNNYIQFISERAKGIGIFILFYFILFDEIKFN